MRGKKATSRIKVISAYGCYISIGYWHLIYSENAVFSSTENKVQLENKKDFKGEYYFLNV
jgi:hypothetical protein